ASLVLNLSLPVLHLLLTCRLPKEEKKGLETQRKSPIVFQTSPVRVLFEPYRIPNKSCSGSV
ncbi:hypothetical protein, partial [Leptospira santarosai]|uniref:hypothetical protein n=1 Tax=Leptospira santarosai TaxID=28183 RepID=UPI0024AF2EE0